MDQDLRSIQQAREMVRLAKAAQKRYRSFTQDQVDAVVEAMVEAGAQAAERLGKMAREETGFGRPESKTQKNLFTIAFEAEFAHLIVPVGSIAVDGVSLTVARLGEKDFSVAIIPYTYEHTVVKDWAPGRRVNLEFDLVGKYVTRWLALRKDKS